MAPVEDWISRITVPDLYPRRDDPFRPAGGAVPPGAPPASMIESDKEMFGDVWDGWLTQPGQRPIVYQRALNFNITADLKPLPISNGGFQCDTIVVDVLSTAANSVFFGWGGSIDVNTGIEVRAGLPLAISADNGREQWELQRLLEMIGAMLAADRGYQPPGPYKAPRVVFNASEFYVVAAVPTNVRIMLFTSAEYQ